MKPRAKSQATLTAPVNPALTGPAKWRNAIDDMPQEMLAAIGEIIARWGYLHYQLHVVAREITGLKKDTGRALLIGPELNVLCGIIRTLTQSDRWVKDELIRADLRALESDVRAKSDHRHDYAHGVFGYGEQPGTFIRLLFHAKAHRLNPSEEVLEVAHLKTMAKEAADLWARAQDITVRLKALKQKSG